MDPLAILRRHRDELKERFYVREIGVFGSRVRGDARATSDVDVLVEFDRPVDLFHFLDLHEYLEELLGAKVDLTTRNALKPRIRDAILREVVYA